MLTARNALSRHSSCRVFCRLSSHDPPALGTTELAAAVVQHLLRIVDGKAAILQKSRDPSDTACLMGFVQWLFEQIGAPETQYRRKCMQLFVALARHAASGKATGSAATAASDWVARFVGDAGIDHLVSIIEPLAASALPSPLSVSGEAAVDNVSICVRCHFLHVLCCNVTSCGRVQVATWLESVSTAMDAYTWLFQQKFVLPQQVFASTGGSAPSAASSKGKKRSAAVVDPDASSLASKSTLLPALRHFLAVHVDDTAFSTNTAESATTAVASGSGGFNVSYSSFTPRQLDVLRRGRAVAVCRVFTFLAALLDGSKNADVISVVAEHGVLCQRLYRLSLECILSPAALGIDTVDSQVCLLRDNRLAFLSKL